MECRLKSKVEAEFSDMKLKKEDLQKALAEATSSNEELKDEVVKAWASEEDAEGLKDRILKIQSVLGDKYKDFFMKDEVDPIKDIPMEDGDES